jgi:hypothetical protein
MDLRRPQQDHLRVDHTDFQVLRRLRETALDSRIESRVTCYIRFTKQRSLAGLAIALVCGTMPKAPRIKAAKLHLAGGALCAMWSRWTRKRFALWGRKACSCARWSLPQAQKRQVLKRQMRCRSRKRLAPDQTLILGEDAQNLDRHVDS